MALQPGEACILVDPEEDAALWPWRATLLGMSMAWGANFAIVKVASEALGNDALAVTLFTAARFVIDSTLLSPFLLRSSSSAVISVGLQVGGLTTVGYMAQVAALAYGTQAGTAAFICSLNAVVVALLIGRKTGCVSPRTWWAIALSVAGVGCLELPGAIGGGGGICIGDAFALGQPLGFGASYVLLEQALADHPEDELPIAALQVLTSCLVALGAASFAYGAVPWDLPWATLLPHAPAVGDAAAAFADGTSAFSLSGWSVSAPLLYAGCITTGLTIWLQMLVFSKLPALDISVILTTEPLFAALAAVWLLGDAIGLSDCAGGALILAALAVNQGLLFSEGPPRLTYDMKSSQHEEQRNE